ncbi:MAG TPA: MarR family transcriptional regulator [Tepidisphaeraceae bacterium]|jgi:DNA-binding MarR family transcriptional regulator
MRSVRIPKRVRPAPAMAVEDRRRGKPDPLSDLFLVVQRTADRLMQGLEDALRATGITPVQYLLMRSLRQAGADGMASNRIVRNMTTHDPDLTRLLDKLEEREIIERRRDREDRRIYRVKLTRQGARVLRELTIRTRDLHRQQFSRVNKRSISTLMALLEDVNEAPIPDWDERD